MLEINTFKNVIKSTPLISIDLIVRNSSGEILLGYRNNRPAQGYWFVPGGRILKDERIRDAFSRLTGNELGKCYEISQFKFQGVFEHLYNDNFSSTDFTTHYIVLGYNILLDHDLKCLPREQHCDYRWWSINDLMDSIEVHENTKAYFR
ncbi:GDP-mannose mannosyl hydrolase [Vibrio qinghaiensis]|uniref:GDP-mannose mannosyl hydrolase n=1 Tax=Vibrio qinghaiensis TaxID=2025808 RepID=A0A223N0M8_9VIBR|nr:GDP-mannose mannosyl hydrolase [Vibrio qinghaiensis]ASU23339.1 GDP-mannose mannosyl hydrolase [Vibrio qinghaiensis]